MLEKDNFYHGDNLDLIKLIDDNYIDLTITSPPYDDIRTYDNIKNWGHDCFKKIANELFRVTKSGGVVVWVVGDQTKDGTESGTSFRQALYFKEIGYNIHDTMIYAKTSTPYPFGFKSNRYTQAFEYMFVFSKGKPKTSNLIKDKKNYYVGINTATKRQKNGDLVPSNPYFVNSCGYRTNIWEYSQGYGKQGDHFAIKHPASFPEKLVEDHILTWSNVNDIVLDPFAGPGTVLKVAKKAKRHYIGFEIN